MGKKRTAAAHACSREDLRAAIAFGTFVAWNGLAFRIANAPEVSFPWSLLSFPRHDEAWLSALLAIIFISLAAGTLWYLMPEKRMSTRQENLAIALSGVAMAASTGGLVNPNASLAATLFFGVICGTGMVIVLQAWIPRAQAHDGSQLTHRMLFGFIVAFVLDATIGILPQEIALFLVSALPLVTSAFLLTRAGDAKPKRPTKTPEQPFANTLTACIAMFGFAVFMGIIGFDYDLTNSQNMRVAQAGVMAGGAAFAAIILFALGRFSDIGRLQVIVPIVLTTSFVLLPLSATSFVREIAVVLAQATLLLTFVVVALAVRQGKGRESARRFPFLIASLAVLNLLGVIVGGVIRNSFGLDATALTFTALLIIYFVLLVALPLSRCNRLVKHVIQGASIASPTEIARIRRDALAERYPSLSTREKDVLLLMLQSYSNQRMADALIVSESTVKTHVRHVYAKMGIRSRQQLLIEAEDIPLEMDE